MSRQPGLSAANITDHIFRVAESDPNHYVGNATAVAADAAAHPGPQNVVIVTIPGAVHPEETVVIGEHPDGATSSTFGSAYDDAQGAAEVAGIARTLLSYWTSHHLWPARTVQFVLFDGEEQGLFGSFFYQSQLTPPGAVDANRFAAMYNVDSNGMGYPARHLGLPDHPLQGPWFFYIQETPLSDFSLYHGPNGSPYPRLISNRPAIQRFHDSTNQAVQQTWSQLSAIYRGRPMPLATYPTAAAYPTACAIPATCVDTFQDRSEMRYLLQVDDIYGGTDQDPFIRCGIPAYGLDGGTTTDQYEPVAFPPGVANPASGLPFTGYDTPVDNIGSLNFLASGRGSPYGVDISPVNELDTSKLGSEALRRSLLLTGQLVVNQSLMPDSAGAVPMPTRPVAHFLPDRFELHAGESTHLHATPGPVPATATWTFDDGSTATGPDVVHSFAAVGMHPVRLTMSAATGTATYTAAVRVVAKGADANTYCGQVAGEAAVVPVATTAPAAPATGGVSAASGPAATPNTGPEVPLSAATVTAMLTLGVCGLGLRRRRTGTR
jgi:hypothetical protein